MPPRDWRLRANDILEAAERAQTYVQGLTLEQLAADPRNVDAVSYAIMVIGEAAPHRGFAFHGDERHEAIAAEQTS